MELTLITVTKNRPVCFSCLEKWIAAQDYKGSYQWIVVNDSEIDYSYGLNQIVFRRSDNGMISICGNWLTAVEIIDTSYVIVLEDDDYYCPYYLSQTIEQLNDCDLFGWSHNVYYNVRFQRSRRLLNVSHSALAATAFRSCVLPVLGSVAARGNVFFDSLLWDEFSGRKKLLPNDHRGRPLTVGIKGHGEGGIMSVSHTDTTFGTYDNGRRVLRQWLGKDSLIYEKVMDELN